MLTLSQTRLFQDRPGLCRLRRAASAQKYHVSSCCNLQHIFAFDANARNCPLHRYQGICDEQHDTEREREKKKKKKKKRRGKDDLKWH